MKKKFLSLFMALCLVLSLAPAAFATDTTMTQDELEAAISAANVGGTVELTGNVDLTETLTIEKSIILDGKNFTITGASGVDTIYFNGVTGTVKNATIVSGYYAIVGTGSSLNVSDCTIATTRGGISFEPTVANANLNVSETVIQNSNVSDYDTTVYYGTDNRGINTYNVKGGTVVISDCMIEGFKYALNPVVSPVGYLRDGNDTTFSVTNSHIVGWTALNMWSANTNFTFTNCTLIGINRLTEESNGFATIKANDSIYGSSTDKESVVKLIGGHVYAVKYNEAPQAIIGVDNAYQTKFVFEKNGDDAVDTVWFSVDNEGESVYTTNFWNFYFLDKDSPEKGDAYLASSKVVGYPGNVLIGAGTPADYALEISQGGGE